MYIDNEFCDIDAFSLDDTEYTKQTTSDFDYKFTVHEYKNNLDEAFSHLIIPTFLLDPYCDIYSFKLDKSNQQFFYIDKFWLDAPQSNNTVLEKANVTDVVVTNEKSEFSIQITDMNDTNNTAKMNWFVKNTLQGVADITFTHFPRTSLGNNTNNVTANTRNVPVTNACFVKGTPVLTDQGIIAIDRIVPSVHTIRGMKIVDVLRTRLKEKALYRFEKDALYKNVPNQATTMSPNHCVFYNGKMRRAKEFLNNVTKIEYKGEILYNVLLETHDKMVVNNMIVETLCPVTTSYSKIVPDLPLTLWHRNRKPFRSLPF